MPLPYKISPNILYISIKFRRQNLEIFSVSFNGKQEYASSPVYRVKRETAKSMMDHFLTVIIFIFTFTLRDPIGKFPCFEGLFSSIRLVLICKVSCATILE